MFRQIAVHKDDWELQRILWMDKDQNFVAFQLSTVTYGTRSAPYLAVRVLLQLIEDQGEKYPLAMPALKHERFVDDIYGGADTPEEMSAIATQLKQLCMAGGSPLAKWQSNCPTSIQHVSPGIRPDTQVNSTVTIGNCDTKILGLVWRPATDTFSFKAKPQASGMKTSKRIILSEAAQIFDPLGFISPVTVRAKMLIQQLWKLQLKWDDPVTGKLLEDWTSLRSEFGQLDSIKIPRRIHTLESSSCELHGFRRFSAGDVSCGLHRGYQHVQSHSTLRKD